MIEILKPMYFGNDPNNRKIGIAQYRLVNEPEIVEIYIKHHRSQSHGGGFIYPGQYYISKRVISKYPLQSVDTNHGLIPMYIVPISELKRKEVLLPSKPLATIISEQKGHGVNINLRLF